MADLVKLGHELRDKLRAENPEFDAWCQEGDDYKEERKQLHISKGLSEFDAEAQSILDYFEREGVEFSIKAYEVPDND
jgi:hypothetical protein